MKIAACDTTFAEVPGHTALVLAISGCKNRCEGCHSPHLRDDIGEELTVTEYRNTIKKYDGVIDAVCFLGGDHDPYLEQILIYSKNEFPNIKTALYTGNESVSDRLIWNLDFLKTGPYIEGLGPLSSKTTNQRMYSVEDGHILNDITHKFQ